MNISYYYALGSAFGFALSTFVYGRFTREISAIWMNTFKASIAAICFGIMITFTSGWSYSHELGAIGAFLLSGFIGLNIGDIYLLRALSIIGPARTLMIFRFQPIFIGITGYLAFGETPNWRQGVAIVLMMSCILTLSYESFKKRGHWEWRGLMYALAGVLLDTAGILLTRFGFEADIKINVFEGNFYRCVGAILGFILMSRFYKIHLMNRFLNLSSKNKTLVICASFIGTFFSLWMWLAAVQTGDLATVTAISGLNTVFTIFMESIYKKEWPGKYAFLALTLSMLGFYILL